MAKSYLIYDFIHQKTGLKLTKRTAEKEDERTDSGYIKLDDANFYEQFYLEKNLLPENIDKLSHHDSKKDLIYGLFRLRMPDLRNGHTQQMHQQDIENHFNQIKEALPTLTYLVNYAYHQNQRNADDDYQKLIDFYHYRLRLLKLSLQKMLDEDIVSLDNSFEDNDLAIIRKKFDYTTHQKKRLLEFFADEGEKLYQDCRALETALANNKLGQDNRLTQIQQQLQSLTPDKADIEVNNVDRSVAQLQKNEDDELQAGAVDFSRPEVNGQNIRVRLTQYIRQHKSTRAQPYTGKPIDLKRIIQTQEGARLGPVKNLNENTDNTDTQTYYTLINKEKNGVYPKSLQVQTVNFGATKSYVFKTNNDQNDQGKLDPWFDFRGNKDFGFRHEDTLYQVFKKLELKELQAEKRSPHKTGWFKDPLYDHYKQKIDEISEIVDEQVSEKQKKMIAKEYQRYRASNYQTFAVNEDEDSAIKIPSDEFMAYAATMVENFRQANRSADEPNPAVIINQQESKYCNTAFMEAAAIYCEMCGYDYEFSETNQYIGKQEFNDNYREKIGQKADHIIQVQPQIYHRLADKKASYVDDSNREHNNANIYANIGRVPQTLN